jgi:uncharacterized protein YbjT (DUF2867 family)
MTERTSEPVSTILVTGGTGTLGRPTVDRLRAAGHDVRVLSRKTGPGLVPGDLSTGAGLPAALDGADAVVHLATSNRHADVEYAHTLLNAARTAGITRFVLISIVGIEHIPLPYYRDKLVIERLVAESGVSFTVLRASQFHNLLDKIFTVQRFLPVLLAPAFRLQPIAVEDVAERLAELVAAQPTGRVPDIAGPEQQPVPDLARAWKHARPLRRPVVPLHIPGKIFRGYASGAPLGPAAGHITFADYLARRYGVRP